MADDKTSASQESPVKKDDRNDWRWWTDNSAVLIGILSVAVVAMRLLGVARGDPETAYAILQVGGTGNVLIATLVSALGLLAIPATAILGFYAWDTRRTEQSPTRFYQLLVAACTMAFIALYMAPTASLILSVLILAPIIIIVIFAAARHWRSPRWKTLLALSVVAYIFLIVCYQAVSPTPWLPEQNITVIGRSPLTGYVLSQANDRTSILTSRGEEVLSVPSNRIQSIVQCTPHLYAWQQATFFAIIERSFHKLANYPPCQPD